MRLGWLLTLLLLSACKDLAPEQTLRSDTDSHPLPQPAKPAAAIAPSLFEPEPLAEALRKLESAVTGGKQEQSVEALELRAFPTELLLQAEDPNERGRVLLWKYSAGKVQEPVVVQLKGDGKLKENLFSLDGVYLKAIPRLSSLAVDHVDPQDGKVTQIIVRRNLPFSSDVRFRVLVESPRRDGQLDANRFGHPLFG